MLASTAKKYGVVEVVVPKINGMSCTHRDDLTFEFLESWCSTQSDIITMFFLMYSESCTGDTICRSRLVGTTSTCMLTSTSAAAPRSGRR